jgi:hypothetical protein
MMEINKLVNKNVVDPDPYDPTDLDPSLFVRFRIWIRILPSSEKKKVNLGFYLLFCDFFMTFYL